MGALMRRYWLPALLASELPEPDGTPVRVRLLGERKARAVTMRAFGALLN
jgi:hypothetical protein